MGKILITGAGGFIGSHLAELCVEQGYSVKAFIHYNSNNHRGWLEDSKYQGEIEFVSGDIRDYDSVFAALKDCEAVFHLAALIGIPYSYVSPLAYIRTNIEGAYNVLQASREHGTKQILMTSTSETYGTAQYVPIDEKHPLVAQSPYAASKISADQLALSFHRSFGLPVKVVRPFNAFGPRQSARAIIPTIITQILAGEENIKLGNTSPTRDFTFVKDVAEGFLAIYKSDRSLGDVTNIGMGTEISIGDLTKAIASLLNKNVRMVEDQQRVRVEKSEVLRLCCDPSKLKANTSWKPKYDLTRGLKETIAWFEEKSNLYKAELYNV